MENALSTAIANLDNFNAQLIVSLPMLVIQCSRNLFPGYAAMRASLKSVKFNNRTNSANMLKDGPTLAALNSMIRKIQNDHQNFIYFN